MKKEQGPLLYIGQPALKHVQPVMQEIAKAGEVPETPEINETPETGVKPVAKETPSESGRLLPFKEMNVEEKVIYLAQRRIPVPCQLEWKSGSVRGVIERFDGDNVWVLEEEGKETVRVPIAEIVYVRIAGT
ncbi:CotO family spore coat protein [Domibacillus mangrovi]|uniref:Spore coat protein CotO n=1 Tax=Domibacillus mangrovi TaxID=1714354 RepID=A0A1Q5NZB9_9BACI|nr:hypothetical protein [Domibacillus mangrovi]OKL35212.1 hypothetical protein BLL40_16655 [Domibacillus mangrovi]